MKPDTLRRIIKPDDRDIDEMYGLEPVYEPGEGGAQNATATPDEFVAIQCPWCGERLDVHIDVTAGAQSYIEDCQVCCRPMELSPEFEDNGAFHAIRVQRVE